MRSTHRLPTPWAVGELTPRVLRELARWRASVEDAGEVRVAPHEDVHARLSVELPDRQERQVVAVATAANCVKLVRPPDTSVDASERARVAAAAGASASARMSLSAAPAELLLEGFFE